jgi:hypothetical protein
MAITGTLRFHVLTRDDYTCRYCGRRAPVVRITVDHVVPIALGGSDHPGNLTACCYDCNEGKSATLASDQVIADVAALEKAKPIGVLDGFELHPNSCAWAPMYVCAGCPDPIVRSRPDWVWVHYNNSQRSCDSMYGTIAAAVPVGA